MMTMQMLKIGDFVDVAPLPAAEKAIPKTWVVVRAVPSRELIVERKLVDRGVPAYVPKETRTIRTRWRRRRQLQRAIFESLVFVPDYEANLRHLRELVDGVIGFVPGIARHHGVERPIMLVSDDVMASIRLLEARFKLPPSKRGFVKQWDVGQQVRVKDGPFQYFEGRIERLDPHGRLRVALSIFERETPVEFEEGQIEAV